MDWSLYRCGRVGHITYAPDEPHLREHMNSRTASTELWQCLRCGAYVPGEPDGSGPAGEAPKVKRGKQIRGDLILKLFAIERAIRVIIFGAVAYGIWRFAGSHDTVAEAIKKDIPIIRELVKQLGFNLNHALLQKIQNLLHVTSSNLHLLALGVAGLALVSAVESFALWQARRWGEYFALIVTSLGLPFEIYELSKAITVTKMVLFALNIALIVYLVYSRRLFGARGGKEAYEARLRAESVLDEAGKAAAALRSSADPAHLAAGRPRPAQPVQPAAAGSPAAAGAGAAVPLAGSSAQPGEPTTIRRDPAPGSP